ncbi:MAG: hypothetical protein H6867_01640 [Rhodospirillales bacterium]|nr:hypothetical protein [Rhodospirillales bacterium]MCB9997220.1 hypothetical protein [Rhodospirillales bacterium]
MKYVFRLLGICVAVAVLYSHFFTAPAQAACGFNSINDYVCDGGNATAPPNTPAPGSPFPPGSSPIVGNSPPTVVIPPGITPFVCDSSVNAGNAFDKFLDHLKLREGVVNCVYRDSLGYPTVGVGHLVLPQDNLTVGDCITDAQVDAFLQQDAQNAWNAAQAQASAAGASNNPCFAIALGAVNYQLGTGWRTKFPNTWKMIEDGKYCDAAAALENTLWNSQTPVRVDDFQQALYDQANAAGTPCGGP